ncbi:hypothetical protein KZQ38_07430 [Saccharothrix sp. SC076]|nr:hypothetical protein [Saccharothrix obliqua]
MLARALEGSTHLESEVAAMLSQLTQVADGCKGYLWPLLNEAIRAAEGYADRLTAQGTPTPGLDARQPAQPPQRPPAHQSEPDDPPERIEQLRRELPPPVVPSTGQRTHGRWIGPDGQARPITSGKDARSDLAERQLAAKGLPSRTLRSGDVEMKLAADMAANGIKHATVVINHVPCKGRMNCDTLVPILLPEGATLTVYGINANGTRTRVRYRGAQPWWTWNSGTT